jgi:hypothetical protein
MCAYFRRCDGSQPNQPTRTGTARRDRRARSVASELSVSTVNSSTHGARDSRVIAGGVDGNSSATAAEFVVVVDDDDDATSASVLASRRRRWCRGESRASR